MLASKMKTISSLPSSLVSAEAKNKTAAYNITEKLKNLLTVKNVWL